MQTVTDFLSAFPKMSMDHVIALIALGAMGLSAFAIYVAFAVAALGVDMMADYGQSHQRGQIVGAFPPRPAKNPLKTIRRMRIDLHYFAYVVISIPVKC